VLELRSERGARPKVSLRTRAAQVFAYLLTRGDSAFQNHYLSASETTIAGWATKLRRSPWSWRRRNLGGRPPLAQEIKDVIIKLKEANALWGARRIKDGIWALDFFFVRTAKGVWLNVLLVIDLHTREILDLRACDAWGPTAEWTIRTFAAAAAANCAHRSGRPGRHPGRPRALRRGLPGSREGFLGPAGKATSWGNRARSDRRFATLLTKGKPAHVGLVSNHGSTFTA
jgi:hypothetical protein